MKVFIFDFFLFSFFRCLREFTKTSQCLPSRQCSEWRKGGFGRKKLVLDPVFCMDKLHVKGNNTESLQSLLFCSYPSCHTLFFSSFCRCVISAEGCNGYKIHRTVLCKILKYKAKTRSYTVHGERWWLHALTTADQKEEHNIEYWKVRI